MKNVFDFPLASNDRYSSPPSKAHSWFVATIMFYSMATRVVFHSAGLAKKGKYTGKEWVVNSHRIFQGLERSGIHIEIEGMNHLRETEGPVVIVANHMSTLETFTLPMIVHPVKNCTFVIKPSLIEYPVFGHVMRARNPIVVSRDNPRKDLVTVLQEGKKRLEDGLSIILFPQTSRRSDFSPEEFNSLGVKLAKSAGCPIIPVALKTDAWSNGKLFKDYGKIDPSKDVHFAFGEPIVVEGNGKSEHQQVLDFISTKMASWT
jgi:1-acyl-sn-glycerol-3-phosphate acyltransferase